MRVTIRGRDGEVLRDFSDSKVAQYDAIAVYSQCHGCKREPYAVRLTATGQSDHAVWGDAWCHECEADVGTMRVEFSTIFGAEEDRAMLIDGRARVYGASQ